LFPLSHASERFIADWGLLEERAVEGNMCQSPHFVLPAMQYLEPRKPLMQLAIYRHDNQGEQLIGTGTFIAQPPVASFPLPHLEAYRDLHTLLTGLLLDRDGCWLALEALGAYLSSLQVVWSGISFRGRLADGALDKVGLAQRTSASMSWSEHERYQRAVLFPGKAQDEAEALLGAGGLGKDLRRKRARLDKLGRVEVRVSVGGEIGEETIETFLRLEHGGWKGENASSLLARPGHADFFRDMTRNFAGAGRAFFCELLLDGRVIASSSNYISGRVGFAFKIGWDPEFASAGPGLLVELELMRWLGSGGLEVDYIDSGAAPGSYIERLWRDRIELTSGILAGGNVGVAVLPMVTAARKVKRAIFGISSG
jgi:hypothetical protein